MRTVSRLWAFTHRTPKFLTIENLHVRKLKLLQRKRKIPIEINQHKTNAVNAKEITTQKGPLASLAIKINNEVT